MKTFPALLIASLLSSCAAPFLPMAPQNPAADVAVPMQLRAGTPHIMVSINGQHPIPVLLDTGATMSVFAPEVATSFALLPTGGRRVQIRGVHGIAGASQAVMNTLDLGRWRATNVPCLVRGSSSFRTADGLGSAILGMDHLRRHCSFLTIDYQRNIVELGFARSFQPLSGRVTRTPLRWAMGMPIIRVSSGGIAWDAVVDSGSTWGIVVDQSTAASLGHAHDGTGMPGVILSGVGGSVRADQAGARTIQVPATTLCGEMHPGTTLYVMPGPKRVGSRFWQGTRLTVDFRGNALWLER